MRTRPGPATRPVPWMTSSRAAGALAAGDGPGDGPAVSNQRPAAGTANQSATAAKAAAAPTGRSDPARSTATTTRSVRKAHSSSASDEFENTRGQSQAKPATSAATPSMTASASVPNCQARTAKPALPKASYRSQDERHAPRREPGIHRRRHRSDPRASRRRSPHQQGQTLFRTLRSALRRRLGDLDGSLTRRLRSGRARSQPLAPGLLDAFHGRNLGRLDLVAPVLPPNEHRRPHVVFPFKAVVSPPPAQCEIPRQPWFCPDLSRNFRPQRGGTGPSRVQFRSACRLIAFRHSSV